MTINFIAGPEKYVSLLTVSVELKKFLVWIIICLRRLYVDKIVKAVLVVKEVYWDHCPRGLRA